MSVIKPAALDPFFLNLDTLYQRGYMNGQSTYEQWTQTVISTSKSTVHGWMDKFPKLREWIGPRDINNIVAHSYSLENKKFELSFAVERTDIEDDQMGLYGPAAEMMGMQAREWPDDQMTPVIEAGFTTTTFDGADFYSASHPIDTSGSITTDLQSNLLTSTPLNASGVSDARAQLRSLKGRDNKPLGMNLTHIMVPPALESTALQVANGEFIVQNFGGNTTGGGQTNVLKGTFDVIVNSKLTSDTTWYAFDNRWPIRALVWQLRKAPEFAYLINPTDPNVFNDDQYIYGVRARGVGGYGLYFMSVACTA
jgi:phage major head subunit gpT-like protein